MLPVGVDSVVVVLVVEEAMRGKIEGYDTLLDMIRDLRSPHPAMISQDGSSTPGYRCSSRGCPTLIVMAYGIDLAMHGLFNTRYDRRKVVSWSFDSQTTQLMAFGSLIAI